MQEPTVRTSRLAIAGGLAAIMAVGGAGFLFGRSTAPRPEPVPQVAAPIPVTPPPPPSEAPRTMARADLIDLARRAADAFASNQPPPGDMDAAAGRRFDLVLPFGCGGPSDAASTLPMQWRYDAEAKVLHVSVNPTAWSAADWGLGEEAGVTSAEGFWIARPWSSSEACPTRVGTATPTGVEPVTLPGQTLGIAQFLADGARREGRAFEIRQRMNPEEAEGGQGFRLRLIGRVERIAGAAPVRCIQPAGIEQRPVCVIGMRMDEVRIENPATGKVLGTWPASRPD
ncbi:hypothetical protein [Sphingomonas sp.]|uniref:hypothetical protein n=1 Tax=Sphingomonas sp. TaxID=28214 RepID=UPI003B3B6E81